MKNYNFMLIYKKYNKKANILKNILTLVLIGILSAIVIFYATGKLQIFHVLTNSSAPYHPAGSLAIDYKVDFQDLQVGDFITWSLTGGNSFVTHQIVKVNKDANNKITSVITSQQQFKDGKTYPISEWDSNQFDSPKTESQYFGKVIFSIPQVGLYLTGIRELVILNGSVNILGIIFIILIMAAYYLFAKLVKKPTFTIMGR